MSKTTLIIQREFLTRVKKKSFLIMTILGPLLFALLILAPALLANLEDEAKTVLVVDEPALLLGEDGNVAPLRARLDASPGVTATMAGNALLEPGKSVTFQIQANPWRDRLSLAAMLIPSNDAFTALNAVALPDPGQPRSHAARAYDAGSEVNDELCGSIPGPFFAECGGSGGGARAGGGEGFVHVHRGMHGVGDFQSIARDWRNPVALIAVRRMR